MCGYPVNNAFYMPPFFIVPLCTIFILFGVCRGNICAARRCSCIILTVVFAIVVAVAVIAATDAAAAMFAAGAAADTLATGTSATARRS